MVHDEVKLGEVTLKDPVESSALEALRTALQKTGLQIISDKKSQLVEKIKTLVIEQVHYSDEPLQENFSTYIAKKLLYDYTYLSNLFVSVQGITLEHYIIRNKIERVKELLVYDSLTVAEIAFRMNYSSAAHLSRQFKQVTGFTASSFKKLKQLRFDDTSPKKPNGHERRN